MTSMMSLRRALGLILECQPVLGSFYIVPRLLVSFVVALWSLRKFLPTGLVLHHFVVKNTFELFGV